MTELDLEGVDPDVLIDVFVAVLRRGASDFVLAHHIATALGTGSPWFLATASLAVDLCHDISPITDQENP